jgi:hypothetical protein
MDQILTDVNADYSQYRLFVCSKERRFIHVDVLDRSFDGKCPTDQTELREVDPEQTGCPNCGKELKVQEFKPLSAGESTAAE